MKREKLIYYADLTLKNEKIQEVTFVKFPLKLLYRVAKIQIPYAKQINVHVERLNASKLRYEIERMCKSLGLLFKVKCNSLIHLLQINFTRLDTAELKLLSLSFNSPTLTFCVFKGPLVYTWWFVKCYHQRFISVKRIQPVYEIIREILKKTKPKLEKMEFTTILSFSDDFIIPSWYSLSMFLPEYRIQLYVVLPKREHSEVALYAILNWAKKFSQKTHFFWRLSLQALKRILNSKWIIL